MATKNISLYQSKGDSMQYKNLIIIMKCIKRDQFGVGKSNQSCKPQKDF